MCVVKEVVVGVSSHSGGDRMVSDDPCSPLLLVLSRVQLQRLKRSFSFKTRSLRSRSADNVFDRPGVETPSEPEPEETASRATAAHSPAHSPAKTAVTPGERQHDFHEYVFKKPTFCDMCNHMIVGKP